jgi:hypothetical protein
VFDHLAGRSLNGDRMLECFTTLGALAATTTGLELGTMVVNMSLREPAVVVAAAASVQRISGRPFLLGLGAGAGPTSPWAAELHDSEARLADLKETIINFPELPVSEDWPTHDSAGEAGWACAVQALKAAIGIEPMDRIGDYTSFNITSQGAPVISETRAIIKTKHANIVLLQLYLDSKHCVVFNTDLGSGGPNVGFTVTDRTVHPRCGPGGPAGVITRVEFPELKDFVVFSAQVRTVTAYITLKRFVCDLCIGNPNGVAKVTIKEDK